MTITDIAKSENRTFWRYSLPNDKPMEGWAVILMDDTGMFMAVSDFGDYCYKWTHHGMDDFRKFMLKIEAGYFCGKVSSRTEFQADRTKKAALKFLLELRRDNCWTKDEARKEWDMIQTVDFDNEEERNEWVRNSDMDEAYEFFEMDYPSDVKYFAQRILPRLAEVIKAQLEEEVCILK